MICPGNPLQLRVCQCFGQPFAGGGERYQRVRRKYRRLRVDHLDLRRDKIGRCLVLLQEFHKLIFVPDNDRARPHTLLQEAFEQVAGRAFHIALRSEIRVNPGQKRRQGGFGRHLAAVQAGGQKTCPDIARIRLFRVGRNDLERPVDVQTKVFLPAFAVGNQAADLSDIGQQPLRAASDHPGAGQRVGDIRPGIEDNRRVKDRLFSQNGLARLPRQFHRHLVRRPQAILAGCVQRRRHFDGPGAGGIQRDAEAVADDCSDGGVGQQCSLFAAVEDRHVNRVAPLGLPQHGPEIKLRCHHGDGGNYPQNHQAQDSPVHADPPAIRFIWNPSASTSDSRAARSLSRQARSILRTTGPKSLIRWPSSARRSD